MNVQFHLKLSEKARQPSDSNYLSYCVWPKEIKESRENHSSGLYVNSGQMRTTEIPGRWIPSLNSHSYLDLGSSPSSFLHRTVGTGSPRASHLNSALSSTVTAKLLGLFTKDGLSKIRKSHLKDYWNILRYQEMDAYIYTVSWSLRKKKRQFNEEIKSAGKICWNK